MGRGAGADFFVSTPRGVGSGRASTGFWGLANDPLRAAIGSLMPGPDSDRKRFSEAALRPVRQVEDERRDAHVPRVESLRVGARHRVMIRTRTTNPEVLATARIPSKFDLVSVDAATEPGR